MSRRIREIPKTVRMMQKRDEAICEGKKQIFACECGKIYYAFPAIYLHFKRVHRMKISTRVTQEPCSISENDNSRTFTYLYSDVAKTKSDTNDDDNIPFEKNPLELVLDEFDEEISLLYGAGSFCFQVSSQLKKVVIDKHKYKGKKITFKTVSELPLMFNDFVMTREEKLREQNRYFDTCEALLKISEWLKQKNYSEYLLKPNLPVNLEA